MLAELISIPTDTFPLDGLYYEPNDRPVRGAVLLMHGNGQNFYFGPARFLPEYLVAEGLACLAFNRRGHDILTARTRVPEGNAFQTAAEARADNEYAREFLAERGHTAPVIVGHSNGGLLAARYVADHPETPALVLLSAHCGGGDMLARASALGLLAGDRLAELSTQAHALVAAGRPEELMLLPGWWYVTAAGAFVDMDNNAPRIIDAAPAIACPTLYLRGDQEDPDLYPAERFAQASPAAVDVRIMDDCDHFYTGHTAAVGALVAEWVTTRLT